MAFDQREAARIVRRPLPELSETPVACASRLLTPVDRFYRRNHFPEIPQVPDEWEVRIVAGDRVLRTVSAAEFADLPTSERTTVLECAGNGGSGEHLKRGGFGVARWTGVSVASILGRLQGDEVWRFATFRGRDRGRDPDEDGAVDYYQRSIPLDVAREGALLASHMNGSGSRPITASRCGWWSPVGTAPTGSSGSRRSSCPRPRATTSTPSAATAGSKTRTATRSGRWRGTYW